VAQLGTSVFIIPGQLVKNADERLVFLNRTAKRVIDRQRGMDDTFVFTFQGRPIRRTLNTGWKRARETTGLSSVRVRDLKHTFGRRLRASGVSFEDRQDLLGHRSGRITTHYSAAELSRLIEAADRVSEKNGKRPEIVVLRGQLSTGSRETHANLVTSASGVALTHCNIMAGEPGFEPGLTESESVGLPLTYSPRASTPCVSDAAFCNTNC